MVLLRVFFRINTELWDVETSTSTVISPSLPDSNYAQGASFLLSAKECRQSGKLSFFKSTVKLFKKFMSNLIFYDSQIKSFTTDMVKSSANEKILRFCSILSLIW